ncbi:MAG: S-layer protein [Methanoregula sp.]
MNSIQNISRNQDSHDKAPARHAPANRTGLWCTCLIVITIACVVISPALAGTKYMAGSPELTAYISGTNEFDPGETVPLTVIIENKGINEFKFVQSGIVDREDLPNTAKFLKVSLDAGTAPITIKSDPQMIGDVKSSTTGTSVFTIKVLADAPAGTYNLPLTLDYSYLYEADQYGSETIQYYYKHINENVSLPVTIKKEVRLNVLSAVVDHLNAGTEGYVTLEVKNIGHEDGKKAVLKITRNDNSPITPKTSTVYIGDFPAGGTVNSQFKVTVTDDAEEQVYPLDLHAEYENAEGDVVSSDAETIGLPVGKKVSFVVSSMSTEIMPGQKKVITVVYKNTGGAPAYNAQARISAVDPFTTNDDTAFLGTLAPGESKEASFEISTDKTATIKEYGVDSEIRFRDALDNTIISDPMKVRINVVPDTSMSDLLNNRFVQCSIVVVIIVAGYLIYRRKMIAQ